MARRSPTFALRRFAADDRAASAVEFALILPVLLVILLSTYDITRAIDLKSRSTQLSRTVSDFVSQNKSVSKADVANIIAASKSVFYPYSDGGTVLTVEVQHIYKSGSKYMVAWSYKSDSTVTATKTEKKITDYTPSDDFTVRTQVSYVYDLQFKNVLKMLNLSQITLMSETAMSPRWGAKITASGTW